MSAGEADAELERLRQGVRGDLTVNVTAGCFAAHAEQKILVKIVVRRLPLYNKEWAAITCQMIEQAARVLDEAIET